MRIFFNGFVLEINANQKFKSTPVCAGAEASLIITGVERIGTVN